MSPLCLERTLIVKLLHIDSSLLGANSVSRGLTAEIVEQHRRQHPGIEVVYRDLAVEPHLDFSPAHLAGGETPDPVIDELFAADIIVIGAPMYNLTIPSKLKAWIDRSSIAGRTFRYTPNGPEGLLPKDKKVIVVSSRGGFYGAESPMAPFDHQETYLKHALGFIGLTDVTVVRAEGLAVSPESREAALISARQSISALAA
jgi:FMN-dependent NADH-azoreductase